MDPEETADRVRDTLISPSSKIVPTSGGSEKQRSRSISPLRSISFMLGNLLDGVRGSSGGGGGTAGESTSVKITASSPSSSQKSGSFFRNPFSPSTSKMVSSAGSTSSTFPRDTRSSFVSSSTVPLTAMSLPPVLDEHDQKETVDHFPLPSDAQEEEEETSNIDQEDRTITHEGADAAHLEHSDHESMEPAAVSESVPSSRPASQLKPPPPSLPSDPAHHIPAPIKPTAAATVTSDRKHSVSVGGKHAKPMAAIAKIPHSSGGTSIHKDKEKEKDKDKGHPKKEAAKNKPPAAFTSAAAKSKASSSSSTATTTAGKDATPRAEDASTSANHMPTVDAEAKETDSPAQVSAVTTEPQATDDTARAVVVALDEVVAVSRLQMCIRRFVANRRVYHRRVERKAMQLHLARWITWATISIQRIVRGKLGRARAHRKAVQVAQERTERRWRSAIHIQRMLRGLHARRRIVPKKRKEYQEQKQHREWIASFQKKTTLPPPSLATPTSSSSIGANDHTDGKRQAKSPDGTTEAVEERSPVPKLALKKKKKPHHAPTSQDPEATASSQAPSSTPSSPTKSLLHSESVSSVLDAAAQEKLSEIDARLQQLAELEQRIKDSEAKVQQQAQEASKKLEEQLQLLADQTKKAEAERLAQNELLQLAAGPIQSARRTPYGTITATNLQQRQQMATNGTSSAMSTLMRTNGPPTGRSARSGNYPPNAPRLSYNGQEWVQLWDYDENAYYWWCEASQTAQWEQPGMDAAYYYNQYGYATHGDAASMSYAATASSAGHMLGIAEEHSTAYNNNSNNNDDVRSVAHSESSIGGMTDISMDQESVNCDDVDYAAAAAQGWHEYWDESAQAKYWYNDNTVRKRKKFFEWIGVSPSCHY